MYRSFISILMLGLALYGHAQDTDRVSHDTLQGTDPYGIRFGIDLSRPVITLFNDRYTGLEIVGDYRLTAKWHLAAELGNEQRGDTEILGDPDKPPITELYDYEAKGSYIKIGADYNTYENWYGMYNAIHVGGRYAYSTFSQTLNRFNYFNSNRYFSPDGFSTGSTESQEFSSLNASWIEAVIGVKVELFARIYLGGSVRLGYLVTNKEPENFRNLWIPGFNKVTDGSRFGVGFNYTLTYYLPLYKKAKELPEENNQ